MSNFNFKLGTMVLPLVTQYKYFGIVITEFIDYNVVAQIVANAANKALGSVINKYKEIDGFGYYTYIKLFHSAVRPILDYASEVWGYKNFTQIDAVQNKAIRICLGCINLYLLLPSTEIWAGLLLVLGINKYNSFLEQIDHDVYE